MLVQSAVVLGRRVGVVMHLVIDSCGVFGGDRARPGCCVEGTDGSRVAYVGRLIEDPKVCPLHVRRFCDSWRG